MTVERLKELAYGPDAAWDRLPARDRELAYSRSLAVGPPIGWEPAVTALRRAARLLRRRPRVPAHPGRPAAPEWWLRKHGELPWQPAPDPKGKP